MKRRLMMGAGLAAAAAFLIPAVAIAQVPPGPPAVYYGSATGAQAGQGVIAIVISGNTSTVCGDGLVSNSASGPVYVVQVISNDQRPGCGLGGRPIRFYFTPSQPGTGGSLATESATWSGSGAKLQNLTPGSPLAHVRPSPMVASDGIQP